MELKRLVIVGAGAVGGAIGGLLLESGYQVVLVARGEHGQKIRSDGMVLQTPDRSLMLKPECVNSVDEVAWQAGDVVMVATKLNDAESVFDQLLSHAGDQIPVVCASNGIHGERWALERFRHVVSMLLWLPATHLVPGEIRLYSGGSAGVLDNGPVSTGRAFTDVTPVSETLCQWLSAASFDARFRSDMWRWKHAKWITNLGNAAQALVTDDWQAIAASARAEGELVLNAAKIDRVPLDEFLKRCEAVRMRRVNGKKRLGGSTWQSRQLGKPLESIWIEGAMADLGDQVGVPTPVNRKLADAAQNGRQLLASEFV